MYVSAAEPRQILGCIPPTVLEPSLLHQDPSKEYHYTTQPSIDFLRFAEWYLSMGKTDKQTSLQDYVI